MDESDAWNKEDDGPISIPDNKENPHSGWGFVILGSLLISVVASYAIITTVGWIPAILVWGILMVAGGIFSVATSKAA